MPELNKVLESLSNRELAFLFWAGLLLLWVLCSASLRKHLASILRLAFGSKLTLYFTIVAGYTIGIAYVLEKNNWWDLTQLKNTVLWYFTVGVFSLADITNQKKSNYFKAAVRDVLGITALLQFAIGVYSFSFIKELLLLPLLVLLGGIQVVAERTSKYQAAARLVSYLLSFFGLFLIGYTLYRMVGDFKSIANEGTLNDFLIPALFSFLFLPLLYFLSILVTHDDGKEN